MSYHSKSIKTVAYIPYCACWHACLLVNFQTYCSVSLPFRGTVMKILGCGVLRACLLGKNYYCQVTITLHMYCIRSLPPANLPDGPAHKLAANYYYTRDYRRDMAPPMVVSSYRNLPHTQQLVARWTVHCATLCLPVGCTLSIHVELWFQHYHMHLT